MENLGLIIIVLVVILFLALFSGLWIGVAIGFTGLMIYLLFIGGSLDLLGILQFNIFNSFIWTSMPLFMFMGNIVFRCGLGDRLFSAAVPLVGIFPGGLLHTNILSCAIFAASSGSSLATAATMGAIALPELKKRNYNQRMALGSLAAGGTLGIMIPPSIPFIVYGAWVGESIGKLFIAGVFPGLLLTFFFMAYIASVSLLNPTITPIREKFNLRSVVLGIKDLLPIGFLILCVLGSIYFGIATPTEAAAVGSIGAIVIAAGYRKLDWKGFKGALLETASTTGMILLCVVGTQIMAMALADLRIPASIAEFTASAGIHRGLVFLLIVLLYLVLGCFIDALSMTLLTLPVTFPLMMKLGFDSIWYGVIVVLMSEIALITPPVGMNLFIIQRVSKEKLSEVVYGALPFVGIMLATTAVLYFFPEIAIWLPRQMLK
ncbi:MAG: TRAP transporter large permease subunit [Deltaproteobacteria bacterium]|nr:TRAP transporter large permease subunit [Deltaproteobacteria bacterium]